MGGGNFSHFLNKKIKIYVKLNKNKNMATKFGIIRKGFIPPSLSNLKVWVKADVGVTLNGAKVTTWADQSGNNRNLVNASSTAQPSLTTNSVNGLPSIYFGGTNASKFLSCADVELANDGGATILFVLKAATQAANIHTPISTNSPYQGNMNNTRVLYMEYQTTGYIGSSGGTFTLPADPGTSFRIMTITQQSQLMYAYRNGVKMNANAHISQGYSFGRLGATPAGVGYSTQNQDYSIAEVLVYNIQLSTVNRQLVESYLNTKYAIY